MEYETVECWIVYVFEACLDGYHANSVYFDEERAEDNASRLRKHGLDAHVGLCIAEVKK